MVGPKLETTPLPNFHHLRYTTKSIDVKDCLRSHAACPGIPAPKAPANGMVPRRRVAGPCLAIAAIAALLSTAGAQAAERIGAAVLSTLGDKVPVRYLEANPECPTCVEVLDVSGVSILRVRDKATGKVVMVQDLGLSGTERLAEGPASWSSAGVPPARPWRRNAVRSTSKTARRSRRPVARASSA